MAKKKRSETAKKTAEQTESPETISVKRAAEAAMDHLVKLLPGVADLLVEETELEEDERTWCITLSYIPRGELLAFSSRAYKEFTINAVTGRVLAMRIRER